MKIYERYGPALMRKAERILQNREDAQDIVQGLFVDMWERNQTSAELPYLFRAVTNRCLNFVRDEKNRVRLLDRQESALRGPIRTRCDERAIGLDLLLKLSDSLDSKCREVLVFHFFDDMTQEEVATVVGTSRKTVGKRLKKIREQVAALTTVENGA